MPSKSAKQAKLMRAVAHGWKPDRIKGPTQSVAKEFVEADKRRGKVTGYQFGGMAGRMGAARGMMPYRGVPRQRPGGGGGGITPGGPGYNPGGPGTWAGRGGTPGGGMPQQAGALRQMFQQRQRQQPGQPGGGGRMGTLGGPGYGPDPLGSAGPGGSLRGGGGGFLQQIMQQYQQQRGQMPGGPPPGPGRGPIDAGGVTPPGGGGYGHPGGVPGTIGGFGGYQGGGGSPTGMLGRMQQSQWQGGGGKQLPGSRIAPPPGKYPGGGNPMLRGRNPMMRGAQRYGGRRGMQR